MHVAQWSSYILGVLAAEVNVLVADLFVICLMIIYAVKMMQLILFLRCVYKLKGNSLSVFLSMRPPVVSIGDSVSRSSFNI